MSASCCNHHADPHRGNPAYRRVLWIVLAINAVMFLVDTLAQAVGVAREHAEPGEVVLLSPACTSFDAYRNFEERGEEFRRLVLAMKPGAR